jgi:predicted metal-dependent phosphoesterase TrpH
MHFHSHHSDGLNRIATIADRARELNIGIAITDHNAIQGAVEIDNYKDILSIPGIEVTSAEGTHILIYFYDIEASRFSTKMTSGPIWAVS